MTFEEMTPEQRELLAEARCKLREWALTDLRFYMETWRAERHLGGATDHGHKRQLLRDLLADIGGESEPLLPDTTEEA